MVEKERALPAGAFSSSGDLPSIGAYAACGIRRHSAPRNPRTTLSADPCGDLVICCLSKSLDSGLVRSCRGPSSRYPVLQAGEAASHQGRAAGASVAPHSVAGCRRGCDGQSGRGRGLREAHADVQARRILSSAQRDVMRTPLCLSEGFGVKRLGVKRWPFHTQRPTQDGSRRGDSEKSCRAQSKAEI
jgi:hypothetical protein